MWIRDRLTPVRTRSAQVSAELREQMTRDQAHLRELLRELDLQAEVLAARRHEPHPHHGA
jgi:hypothetical protein